MKYALDNSGIGDEFVTINGTEYGVGFAASNATARHKIQTALNGNCERNGPKILRHWDRQIGRDFASQNDFDTGAKMRA